VSVVLLAGFLIGVTSCRGSAQEPNRQKPTVPSNETPPTKSEPPVQPVPYSHKKHFAFGLACQECHPNPEPGDRMTLPPAAKCMSCHATVAKEKPTIQKLTEFAKSNQPILWVRVYVVSSWVYWNHRSHLEAKMNCEAGQSSRWRS
jgi:Class III cytochrome C family